MGLPAGRGRLIWIKTSAREGELAHSPATCVAKAEGASVRTLRQIISGDEVIQLVIRLGLLAVLIVWTLLLIRPFVPILAWSVVLAVALNPVFERLAKILGDRPKLAAAILTLISLAVIIGPATWLGMGAVDGIRDLAGQMTAGEVLVPSPPQSIKDWPLVGPRLFDLWIRPRPICVRFCAKWCRISSPSRRPCSDLPAMPVWGP